MAVQLSEEVDGMGGQQRWVVWGRAGACLCSMDPECDAMGVLREVEDDPGHFVFSLVGPVHEPILSKALGDEDVEALGERIICEGDVLLCLLALADWARKQAYPSLRVAPVSAEQLGLWGEWR